MDVDADEDAEGESSWIERDAKDEERGVADGVVEGGGACAAAADGFCACFDDNFFSAMRLFSSHRVSKSEAAGAEDEC
ncbi:MAG: hypothetical protein VXY70_09585 [Actinomycetota bacterium]|nr:hypothetical protein [Actinomycetota bacterium]